MNETYEVMEQEVTEMEPIEVAEGCEECEGRTGSGVGLAALVVGGVLAGTGLIVAAVRKHKKKKAEQPAKPKTKLKLVRVPVEEPIEEVVAEVPAEEIVDNEAK